MLCAVIIQSGSANCHCDLCVRPSVTRHTIGCHSRSVLATPGMCAVRCCRKSEGMPRVCVVRLIKSICTSLTEVNGRLADTVDVILVGSIVGRHSDCIRCNACAYRDGSKRNGG